VLHAESLDDASLPLGLFYPFGADVGDQAAVAMDDEPFGPITLSNAFPLHNKSYYHLYVSDYILCSSASNMLTYVALNS
jgi:hypothetical protein